MKSALNRILILILCVAAPCVFAYQRYCQNMDEAKLWKKRAIEQPDYSFDQAAILLPQTVQARLTCSAKLEQEERQFLVQFLNSYANDAELTQDMIKNLTERDTAPALAVAQVIKDFIEHKDSLGTTVGALRTKLSLPEQGASAETPTASLAIKMATVPLAPAPAAAPAQAPEKNEAVTGLVAADAIGKVAESSQEVNKPVELSMVPVETSASTAEAATTVEATPEAGGEVPAVTADETDR